MMCVGPSLRIIVVVMVHFLVDAGFDTADILTDKGAIVGHQQHGEQFPRPVVVRLGVVVG